MEGKCNSFWWIKQKYIFPFILNYRQMYFYLSDFSDGLFKFYHKVFHTLGGNDDLAYRPSREIQSVGILDLSD